MSRRKVLVRRESNGRPQRVAKDPNLLSPNETKRLLDGAAMGLRDCTWGSTLGRLYLAAVALS